VTAGSLYDPPVTSVEYSVVVPSHDRGAVLLEVLAALEGQVGAPEFEIVVVDDGSSEDTRGLLRSWRPKRPATRIEQAATGPAAARNRGVAAASGRRVAFLGDDTVPEPGWLAEHAAAHARRGGGDEIAVLGYTGWHPRVRRTRFLDYLNDHGLQFGYALIDDPESVPFNFFYTSNLSLDRGRLLEEPFDETFPDPAWEDIEAAWRLFRRGLRLVYEPGARTAHDHPTDFDRFAARQRRAGYGAVVFYRLHPEVGGLVGLGPEGPAPLPDAGRQRRREALVRVLQSWPVKLPRLWEEALRYHYLQGQHQGWREQIRERGGVP
jgi:glycosyltransferase involved in cell wall biosynthesis